MLSDIDSAVIVLLLVLLFVVVAVPVVVVLGVVSYASSNIFKPFPAWEKWTGPPAMMISISHARGRDDACGGQEQPTGARVTQGKKGRTEGDERK